jgi:hypothetical protein
MLRDLRKFSGSESLVAFSGIQFLDLGFREEDPNSARAGGRRGPSLVFVEEPSKETPGEIVLKQIDRDLETGVDRDHATNQTIVSKATYTVSSRQALEYFDGDWLPLPYLKLRDQRGKDGGEFENGPTNWARFRVKRLPAPDNAGNTHRVTMAFDTTVEDRRPDPGNYAAVRADDVRLGTFHLAEDIRDIGWFLKLKWVEPWLREVGAPGGAAQPARRITRADNEPAACLFSSAYLVLLKAVSRLCAPPKLSFIDTASGALSQRFVEVDLVLDVGNSRTCGVLIESSGGANFDLNLARPLELRDLTEPTQVYDRPFASHTEFARAEFGNARRTPGLSSFAWPTAVRVGPEAIRLNSLSTGAEGRTGLSAPKRYLWDTRESLQQWYFNHANQARRTAPDPVGGPIMTRVTESGEVRSLASGETFSAVTPKFSRASIFTFTVSELVFQAVCQINSIHLRSQRANPNAPRRLRRVILTIPTATPIVEREQFERRAKAGVALLWDTLEWVEKPQPGKAVKPQPPEIEIAYDEATCTQIFYLQDQVIRKFRESLDGFMKSPGLTRRRRDDGTLRIASLDIGGGTTDLMVLSYTVDPKSKVFVPKQEFREGFRRAGDDILAAVVRDHVFPAIEAALAAAGVEDARIFLQETWEKSVGDATMLHRRKLFLSRGLAPVALGLLGAFETSELGQASPGERPFSSFFEDGLSDIGAINFLDSAAAKLGYNFSIRDVSIAVDFARLGETVRNAVGGIVSSLCGVVRAFDCDYFLLTGRPSRLPAIRELVLRELPTDPDRIIYMHDYDVGGWYPFGVRGKVGDPKTTVVVGALIATLAERRHLDNFAIESAAFTKTSTANFIGKLTPAGTLPDVDVILKKVNGQLPPRSDDFTFSQPGFIGSRQLRDEAWPANPLYHLCWPNDIAPDEHWRATMPWRIVFATPDEASVAPGAAPKSTERIVIAEIYNNEDQEIPKSKVELRLHTMLEPDGHWLDTGMFKFNDESRRS